MMPRSVPPTAQFRSVLFGLCSPVTKPSSVQVIAISSQSSVQLNSFLTARQFAERGQEIHFLITRYCVSIRLCLVENALAFSTTLVICDFHCPVDCCSGRPRGGLGCRWVVWWCREGF